MNGLFLSRKFFEAVLPFLQEELADVLACSAAGLSGEGSDCLGLDDEISRDHDWGPAFCLWIPEKLFHTENARIEAAFSKLPSHFEGFPVRMRPELRIGRVGPMSKEGFFHRFLGTEGLPRTWRDWRAIPEFHLCSCTSGEIFFDGDGQFTDFRNNILRGYPEELRLKKIAARCMIMAQAGQYNLPRCLQRGETSSAFLAAARFAEAAVSMVFLLNRRYMPFYKWAPKLSSSLPLLGSDVAALIRLLAETTWNNEEKQMNAMEGIESFCCLVAEELRKRKWTDRPGNWLWELGPDIQRRIEDSDLRRLNVMED